MKYSPEQILKAKHEKWFRGDLSYKFHSAQKIIDKAFKETTGQLFIGNCARQWGKTYWAVTTAIMCALKKPKSQIRYGAAFHTDLIEFVLPALDKILEDIPSELKGKFTKVGSSYHFPNGSRIKFVGLDKNPNGLRGNTLDLIIIDECGFVGPLDYIYKSVIIPSTMHRPNAKVIMISTPPSTPAHPFVDYCQKAQLEHAYAVFTIHQNPRINADTIARLARESGGVESTTWRREYMCEFVTDSDLAIIPEWKDEYVQALPRDEFYTYYHKYVGMDLGVKDYTACIFGYYDFKRAALVIEDEFRMNGSSMNTEILVGAIRAKELEVWGEKGELPPSTPFRRVSDNNWPIMMLDFSSIHNLTFIMTNKDSLEAMINEVRLMVQARQIIINPKCAHLIGCMKYGVWDTKKKGFARSSAYGHFDHLAALIYLVRNLAKHTNPIPVDHGRMNNSAWLGNIKEKMGGSHNSRAITKALLPKRPKVY